MNGAGLFFLLLLLLVILPAASWIGFTRWRAHRQGLPPPPLSAYNPFKRSPQSNYPIAPRPSGPLAWVQDKISSLRSGRGRGGGGGGVGGGSGGDYSRATRGRRGFGPLDPDAAWDDRVGPEADQLNVDYEEQELGLHPLPAGHSHALPEYGESRGRSRSREDTAYVGGGQRGLDQRYDEEIHGGPADNPFGDQAEHSSLRGVSPRPAEQMLHASRASLDGDNARKSLFREGPV